MIESADAGLPLRRAFLRVGGKALVRHQFDLANAMGCERIICMSRAMDPELIGLQHAAEAAGRRFHVISSPQELAGLVTARDELFVFSEGLLAPSAEAQAMLERGDAVLVQPADTGVSAGFERLDAHHASAGLMRVPGRLIENLFELPPDCDVASALTRIALQAGVAKRDIPPFEESVAPWEMVTSESEAYAVESDWLARQVQHHGGPATPGRIVARFGVAMFGSSLLHTGGAARATALSMALVMVLGLVAAWLGSIVAGLLLGAIAWMLLCAVQLFDRIESPETGTSRDSGRRIELLGWLLDIELVVLMVWGMQAGSSQPLLQLMFAPVLLVLLVRLFPRVVAGSVARWIADRSVFASVLALCVAVGVLPELTRILAVIVVVAAIAFTAEKRG